MTSMPLRLAVAAVRMWTRLYTWRMPHAIRERRRAEIESDLWECQAERPGTTAVPLLVVARLLFGMVDDVRWRAERMSGHRIASPGRLLAIGAAVAVLAGVLWAGLTASSRTLPAPPAAPDFRARRAPYPAPPPPPPPLCNPPGVARPSPSPCS